MNSYVETCNTVTTLKNLHALQGPKLAQKLQELAQKFLYKSTYVLMQWDKKTKSNPVS